MGAREVTDSSNSPHSHNEASIATCWFSILNTSIDMEVKRGEGWGSSSRVEELASVLSQASLVLTTGQWSVGHDNITEHQHHQGCSETMTKTKTKITVKPTKHQTSPLLKGVTASALLPITVLPLLCSALPTDKPLWPIELPSLSDSVQSWWSPTSLDSFSTHPIKAQIL